MRAVRLYAAGDIRVEDIDAPADLPAGHVRLRVRAAGICGSDLHNYRTGQWISRSPSVAGHEFCGVVIAVGEGVDQFSTGDTVVADSRCWCGDCAACRSGRTNICEKLGFVGEVCDGGFAEQVQLPARLLVRHAAGTDPLLAAMTEPLAVALHALRKQNVPPHEPVLIAGCGTIGGLAALLLAQVHQGPILLADRNAERAGRVAGVVNSNIVELERASVRAAAPPGRVRYAIDATGSVAALTCLIDLLDGGGSIALVGISHGKLDLDPNVLVERDLSLIGCHAYRDEDFRDAVEMLPALASRLEGLLDEVITLDDVPAAYQRLIDGRSYGLKTIIRISQ